MHTVDSFVKKKLSNTLRNAWENQLIAIRIPSNYKTTSTLTTGIPRQVSR